MRVFGGARGLWIAAAATVLAAALLFVRVHYFIGLGILLVAILGPFIAKWPLRVGGVLVLAGPLFFSTVSFGALTVDNVISAAGTFILGIALLRQVASIQLVGPLVYPAGLTCLLILSIAPHGTDVLFNVARFIGIFLLVAALAVATRPDRHFISVLLNTVIVLSSLIIICQPLTGWPAPWGNVEGEGLRYGGLFGHPNFAAYTLAIFSLYQVIRKGSYAKRFALLLPPLLAMMLSGSRTAIIVFGLVMLFALIARPKTVWPFAAGTAFVAVVAGATFVSRFEEFFQTGGFEGGQNAGGWRIIQWQFAVDLAPSPNVWGIGWGNSEKFLPLGLGVHNGFLQFYVETGIVGSVIFIFALITSIWQTRHSLVSSLLWVFALVTTFFDPVLMYPSSLAILLTLVSLQYFHTRADELTKEEDQHLPRTMSPLRTGEP